jgi:Uma2 family endonuclease
MRITTSKQVSPTQSRIPKVYTLWEYLAREERAKGKYEFYNGTIIKMPNAKYNHHLIASNMLHFIRIALQNQDKKYVVLGDGQKIYIESENVAVYPNALVIFEKPIFYQNREDILLHPLLVVEVLSRKTSLYDRTAKFDLYQAISSFKEYVLVDPKKINVETRYREADDLWRITPHTINNQSIKLKSLDISLDMTNIYENVNF